jgi:hypothetical protein
VLHGSHIMKNDILNLLNFTCNIRAKLNGILAVNGIGINVYMRIYHDVLQTILTSFPLNDEIFRDAPTALHSFA